MPGTRYAILIGTRHYPFDEHLADLRAPEQDVDGLADVLSDPFRGRFQIIKRLKNTSHSAILAEILQVFRSAQKDDLVLVYFSGHARLDDQGRLYLAVMNTQSNLLGATSIALAQLKEAIDNGHATRIVIVLDCCFSSVSGGTIAPDGLENSMRLMSSGRGKYILTTSLSEHVAQQKTAAGPSVLTKHLIEGLQTGHADMDGQGYVTVDQLYQYVCSRILAETAEEPLKWDLSGKGGLILAWTPEQHQDRMALSSVAMRARYDTIIQMFRKGEVIPFLGPEVVGHGAEAHPPSAEELVQRLAHSVGFADSADPLTLISQKIYMVAGRGVVYDRLRDIYRPEPYVYRPALTHRFLACFPHPLLILSTAYDTLLEEAFDSVGKRYAVMTHILHADSNADRGKVVVQYSEQKEKVEKCLSEDLVIDLSRWSVIYKIHGTFGLCDPDSNEEIDSIVISEEDYITFVTILDNPQTTIPNQLARLFRKRMFLFLGYSMSDWNSRAVVDVIQHKGNFRRMQPYAIRREATEFERLYWENKGVRLIEAELSGFIRQMADALGIQL
jgi:hypothetical protein